MFQNIRDTLVQAERLTTCIMSTKLYTIAMHCGCVANDATIP